MKKEEDILQRQCESYLKLFKEIKFIHIPKQLQRHIWANKQIPAHVGMIASKALKGLPDLLIFSKSKYLIVELKSENGVLTKEQKEWICHGLIVVRSFDEFKQLISEELGYYA